MPARRRLPPQPLFLIAFLGLSFWLFAPAWSSPTGTTLAGGNGDQAILIWFLRWTPFAPAHGHDLLVAHHLNYPDGGNLMWNASLVLPGLLLAPLTLRFGPVLTLNVVLVLALGLSAWCAYLAIRRFVPGHLAAAAGGLVYGFSPAIRSQLHHHPHISLAFLPRLMLLALHEILVRQRRPPWLAGAVHRRHRRAGAAVRRRQLRLPRGAAAAGAGRRRGALVVQGGGAGDAGAAAGVGAAVAGAQPAGRRPRYRRPAADGVAGAAAAARQPHP
jgi:hypothetical protein